jgi:hypothetical protein
MSDFHEKVDEITNNTKLTLLKRQSANLSSPSLHRTRGICVVGLYAELLTSPRRRRILGEEYEGRRGK